MKALALILLAAAFSAHGATPLRGRELADVELDNYFRAETRTLSDRCLADIKTAADWNSRVDGYRKQLAEMLGHSPMPPRGDLKPVVTGRIERDDFAVENVQFQSLPGLYVTANLYLPRNSSGPVPCVLYVCGHSPVVTNGVSYGNKFGYQHHGIWFARNGYACLVIDTVQLGEIQGLHHGTYREGLWWWNSRGYTPAGVEAWNGIRALDYLSTRREIDTNRFGVTGRSGGGAYSWFITALDQRIKAAAPVAGITDLENHVPDGCVEGHCDCMFFVNTYRWDYPMLAALAAPRPLLLCNTDSDTIFPLDGIVRTQSKVKRVYELLGAEEKFGLVITPGPHKDTQELQMPVMRWFNKYLKGEVSIVTNAAVALFTPDQLKVLREVPSDAINTNIHLTFVPRAKTGTAPGDADAATLMQELSAKCFAGWPSNAEPARLLKGPGESGDKGEARFVIESQPHVRLPLRVVTRPNAQRLVLKVLSGAPSDAPRQDGDAEATTVTLSVRGVGDAAWPGDAKKQVQIRRRFMVLGQTADSMRVWDIRRAIQALAASEDFGKLPLRVEAEGEMAVNALYASLYEPAVKELVLHRVPASHMKGPDYLNVLRLCDVPQAIAAASSKMKVELKDSGEKVR